MLWPLTHADARHRQDEFDQLKKENELLSTALQEIARRSIIQDKGGSLYIELVSALRIPASVKTTSNDFVTASMLVESAQAARHRRAYEEATYSEDPANLEAAALMLDDLKAGTFYPKQAQAYREMFGRELKFLPELK